VEFMILLVLEQYYCQIDKGLLKPYIGAAASTTLSKNSGLKTWGGSGTGGKEPRNLEFAETVGTNPKRMENPDIGWVRQTFPQTPPVQMPGHQSFALP
jgi:hypothetical protein